MTVTINGTTGIAGTNGSAGTPAVQGEDTNTGVFFPAADIVAVATGGSERVRVDSSGNVGIGTNSPASFAGAAVKLVVGSATTTTTPGAVTVYSGTATYGGLYFADGTVGDQLYRGAVEYNHSTDALLLYSAGAERARIDSSGAVTIANLAGTGSRAVNASATGVLSAASDSRLKEEVLEASIPSLAEVMLLKPRAYKWLDDIEKRGEDAAVEIGFFADEVKDIIPSAAPMGNDGYYGFYDRSVIAALTRAIQEQQTLIQEQQALLQELTARVAELENK